MKNLKAIIEGLANAAQTIPPQVPSTPPGGIPIPPRGRPTTPTNPNNPPAPVTPPAPFTLCPPGEPLGDWPPRVGTIDPANPNTIAQCKKITKHFAILRKHLREVAADCDSKTGEFYQWIEHLKNKWSNTRIITGLPIIDIDNAVAAAPVEMVQQAPSQEDTYPIRPNLTRNELEQCKRYKNRCACSVQKLRLEHKLKELELAEKYYYKCPPFHEERAKEKFLAECDRLKGEKPPVDKCGVVGGSHFYGEHCRDYCRKCT